MLLLSAAAPMPLIFAATLLPAAAADIFIFLHAIISLIIDLMIAAFFSLLPDY